MSTLPCKIVLPCTVSEPSITPPSVKERALYLNEQLQLPEEERVLSIKELDEGQVMHKPGKL